MAFSLSSPAFAGEEIPKQYTCQGIDSSPPLVWSGVPAGTRSLALIVEDPDAPDPAAPKRVFVHWVLYNLPPGAEGIGETSKFEDLPAGTGVGTNDFGKPSWGGPCPPKGRHRYFFRLFALDRRLPDLHRPDKATLLRAIEGHVLGTAVLMGTYEKS